MLSKQIGNANRICKIYTVDIAPSSEQNPSQKALSPVKRTLIRKRCETPHCQFDRP